MFSLLVFLIAILSVNGDTNYDDSGEIDGRIVGGSLVAVTSRPFQVGLMVGQYSCGGSLIEVNWIVTAGHCLEGLGPTQVWARAGSKYLYSDGDTRAASALFTHPNYNPTTVHSDIALVKLKTGFTLGDKIKLINLALSMPTSGYVTVSGFGQTSETGPASVSLKSVTIPILSDSKCYSAYGNDLTSSMFCAGTTGADSCYGDSGGPVTYQGELLGVVSWGYYCAASWSPGINTRVPLFVTWIRNTINSNL